MDAHIPTPPSERRAWVLAGALVLLGVCVLAAVLSGLVGRSARKTPAAPPLVSVAAAPAAGASGARQAASAATAAAIVATPADAGQSRALASYVSEPATQTHIGASWMARFYPIYAEAQRTFGVNWLLLASIHRQETAFSTNPTTYHGLNFAGCCGGPMQFNVTNGPISTWALVSDSYLYGRRPAAYDHMSARHPSLYDDFDSIMAAARLLSSDGATLALDGAAWGAAYDYYGHDEAGIAYADRVLARAISWSQHGWCINCADDPSLQEAVHGAYGAAVAEADATAASAMAQR